jgi:hypothetical protein
MIMMRAPPSNSRLEDRLAAIFGDRVKEGFTLFGTPIMSDFRGKPLGDSSDLELTTMMNLLPKDVRAAIEQLRSDAAGATTALDATLVPPTFRDLVEDAEFFYPFATDPDLVEALLSAQYVRELWERFVAHDDDAQAFFARLHDHNVPGVTEAEALHALRRLALLAARRRGLMRTEGHLTSEETNRIAIDMMRDNEKN